MRAALRAMRTAQAGTLVLAVPVAPTETLAEAPRRSDDIVCLESPTFFGAIGAFYDDFRQVTDDEVIALLDRAGTSASAAKRS